jgi:hypothetical protein
LDVADSVNIAVHHIVTAQVQVVHQVAYTVTLYFEALSTVKVCVSVFVHVVCVAQLTHVAHQAHTVHPVSAVSVGVVTTFVPIAKRPVYISPVNKSSLSVVSHIV